jgi:hypothetical protein
MIPVTDADRRRWQRRDAAALVELLAMGSDLGLPPLVWRVLVAGPLFGSAYVEPQGDPRAALRAAFAAWAGALGAEVVETRGAGMVRLRIEATLG